MKSFSFLHSIRFRLAAWFVIILGLVLLAFGAIVYYREAAAIRAETTARLNNRIRELRGGLFNPDRDHEEDQEWQLVPGLALSPLGTTDDEIVLSMDPAGKLTGTWGTVDAEAAQKISAIIYSSYNQHSFTYNLPSNESGENQSRPYIFLAEPFGRENVLIGWLAVGQPFDPDNQLPRLFLSLALGGGLTLLLALLGSYWLADRALRPVQTITRTARQIGESDLNRRLNIRSRDELGQLAETFDRMLDRLQAAFARQRQFTADASHELRTPLTIIGLETERALNNARSTAEFRKSMQVIQSENEFMTHLVGELLTLARMDSGQAKLRREKLDLSDLALEVVERYTPLAAEKGVVLLAGDLPDTSLVGDRQYLAQMIGNLVENAIKYTPAGKDHWVRVETGCRWNGGQALAWVQVSDNGPGIAPDHIPHLFERFYRADPARSHNPESGEEDIPSSGLGLAIVQWIAQMHGGVVTVKSEPGHGATFEVELKA